MTGKAMRFLLMMIGVAMVPSLTLACACGCNVFTVGARWTMPTSAGFGASLQYNYMNQTRNWSDWKSAPADAGADQEIQTHFYTIGLQFMPVKEWGVMVEAPVWNRYFRTLDDDGNPVAATHTALGDVRVLGMYTGLSEDMSTGLQFGLKLPTGPIDASLFDRDTQIGTGTTDLLLGAYQMGQEDGWGWYGQVMWQHALNTRDEYLPGDSFDVNVGVHYDGLLNSLRIVPVLQVAASMRGIDSGANAHPDDTGYERLYLAPGLQVVAGPQLTLFTDIKIPLTTHVRGVQLVAPALVNVTMGFRF